MFTNGTLITQKLLQKCFKNISNQITPNIFLGNQNASHNKKHLLELGITHIIRVGKYLEDHYKDTFKYLSIDILDTSEEKIYGYFHIVYKFIEECISTNGKVFVHCYAGVSRSATLVCSYLMKKNQIDRRSALKMIAKEREIIDPNSGFIRQLDEYYLKEVSNQIKVPRKYRNRSYCTYNFHKDGKSSIKLSVSNPKTKKIHDKKFNTKNISSKKLSLVENKIKLYRVLDQRYEDCKKLSRDEIRI